MHHNGDDDGDVYTDDDRHNDCHNNADDNGHHVPGRHDVRQTGHHRVPRRRQRRRQPRAQAL